MHHQEYDVEPVRTTDKSMVVERNKYTKVDGYEIDKYMQKDIEPIHLPTMP